MGGETVLTPEQSDDSSGEHGTGNPEGDWGRNLHGWHSRGLGRGGAGCSRAAGFLGADSAGK